MRAIMLISTHPVKDDRWMLSWRNDMLNDPLIPRPVVSRDKWLAARRALLAK
jgi:hypothetical protein